MKNHGKIEQFMSLTGCNDSELALSILESEEFDMDEAIIDYEDAMSWNRSCSQMNAAEARFVDNGGVW